MTLTLCYLPAPQQQRPGVNFLLAVSALLMFTCVFQPAAAQQPALVVCVSPRPPFIFYNETTQTIKGYEWDLFDLVATTLALNYTPKLLPWDSLLPALLLPASDPDHCDIAPSAVPLTFPVSPTPGSIKYSIPTFRSGYSIVTSVIWNPFDRWSFGRVFSNELWVALLSTASLLAVLAYLAERDYTQRGLGKTKYPVPLKPGMYEAVYNCVGKLFNIVQDIRVTSLPGKLISLAWGFLVLVVISMYTGVVTAFLTATTSATRVQGLGDLQAGRLTAISADSMVQSFGRQGFVPRGVPFGSAEQQQAALTMVASGAADALVAESPWLRYQVADRCDLIVVDQMFKYVSNVVLFSPETSDTLVYQYNSQLTYQQAQGMYEILQAAYFKAQNTAVCTQTSYVITLRQLEGLWFIMLAFVGLAALIIFLPRVNKRFEMDTRLTRSASSMNSVASLASQLGRSGKNLVERIRRSSNGASMHGANAFFGDAGTASSHHESAGGFLYGSSGDPYHGSTAGGTAGSYHNNLQQGPVRAATSQAQPRDAAVAPTVPPLVKEQTDA